MVSSYFKVGTHSQLVSLHYNEVVSPMYWQASVRKASLAQSDFRALFDLARGSHFVLTPALPVTLATSDVLLRATKTGRGRFWIDTLSTSF